MALVPELLTFVATTRDFNGGRAGPLFLGTFEDAPDPLEDAELLLPDEDGRGAFVKTIGVRVVSDASTPVVRRRFFSVVDAFLPERDP